jgi:hypothetical protein
MSPALHQRLLLCQSPLKLAVTTLGRKVREMSYPAFWLIILLGSYGTYGKSVDHVPFPTRELCEATQKRFDELYAGEKTLLCVQTSAPSAAQ